MLCLCRVAKEMGITRCAAALCWRRVMIASYGLGMCVVCVLMVNVDMSPVIVDPGTGYKSQVSSWSVRPRRVVMFVSAVPSLDSLCALALSPVLDSFRRIMNLL